MNEEGTVLHPYKDQVGILTIGCGHVIKPGERFGVITLDQAMNLLRNDVKITENAINTHVKVELNQNQYDSLSSFIFNVGVGAFEGSSLLKKVNEGNFADTPAEFEKWCHAGGQINQVLFARRKREAVLFLQPMPEQTVFIEPAEPPMVKVEDVGECTSALPSQVEPAPVALKLPEIDPRHEAERFTFILHWIVLGFGFWAKLIHEIFKHFK